MLKKKLVTIVAAAFCVALVTAQQSGVNKVTTGLIEDGAIDSLKFGTEDGSGVIFGQYDHDTDRENRKITLGWGNSLSDTLWLSVFDSWYFKAFSATTKETAVNNGTADDGINVDYTATTRKTEESNNSGFKNDLGVGVGINDKLGFQLVWAADYDIYKNAPTISGTSAIAAATTGTVKNEVKNPSSGAANSNYTEEWTKIVNHDINNNFTVNFKGIGIEDVGDIAFFVKLNKVYFKWENIVRSGEYTRTDTNNGKTTSETSITGKATENTLNPGLNFDLGLNLVSNDVATVKFIYEDDFNITFKPRTNESEKVVKTPANTYGDETIVTNSYKVDYGKYLAWENKFEPKFAAEFNVTEPLKLKAQLALPVTIGQTINEAASYESSTKNEKFDRQYGYSYMTSKTTTTGELTADAQNEDEFKFEVAPKLSAGFVYEVAPGKFNLSFGAAAQPTYTWKTTTKLNPNINTVTVTETGNYLGNVTSAKSVTAAIDNGDTETKTTALTTTTATELNLGATWFFTENVSFDVYFKNSFGINLFTTTNAGASVTVKF